ncbi:MAG: galactitol-1-phosphate 5-dehydrogenase [Halanaerobiales bacterium]|nr:galactitol-1-phosphate 5-dehydrogenase [Halanaerobiales bacterium]
MSNQKMRAVRLFAPGDIRCVEIEKPDIKEDDDIIIKVKACGVCGSDIERVMEKGAHEMPLTIGHEFAGVVEQTGKKAAGFESGDRVTVMPLLPCGECDYCKVGEFVLCENYSYYGSRINGAMAEYIRVKPDNVLKLPENVNFEMGAMTDPISVALHAVRQVDRIEAGQKAAVLGMGPIGYAALQWLKNLGCGQVYAVDIFDEKLNLANQLGADFCINGKSQDVVEEIMKQTNGEGVDIAIELAGTTTTQVQSIQILKKMGTAVYAGISYDNLEFPNKTLNSILREQLNIKGSWNSKISPLPINEWKSSLEFMNTGQIKTRPLISHRFRLEDCQECFDMMYNKTEVFTKVLFKPEK